MDLVQSYIQRTVVGEIENKLNRSLLSISSNKLRNHYSVVITMNNSKEAKEAEKFLNDNLNGLVERGIVQKIRIRPGKRRSSKTTLDLIKPFISKPCEREKDTLEFYEPDECTIQIKMIVKKVQRRDTL